MGRDDDESHGTCASLAIRLRHRQIRCAARADAVAAGKEPQHSARCQPCRRPCRNPGNAGPRHRRIDESPAHEPLRVSAKHLAATRRHARPTGCLRERRGVAPLHDRDAAAGADLRRPGEPVAAPDQSFSDEHHEAGRLQDLLDHQSADTDQAQHDADELLGADRRAVLSQPQPLAEFLPVRRQRAGTVREDPRRRRRAQVHRRSPSRRPHALRVPLSGRIRSLP